MSLLAVAHRGDPRGAVENTLAAIRLAGAAGADAIEVDLRRTADGVLVLHHDDDLTRLWGRPERVADLTLSALRALAPDVPTLAEALETAARPLLLDTGDPELAVAALAEIAGAGAMFCGSAEAMAAVRARDDHVTLFLSWYGAEPPAESVLTAVRPQYYNPEHRFLSSQEVRVWHDRGIKVSCWTVDDAVRREELISWGVDAIISNDVEGVVKSCA
ncbi:glycerophosphodiester phosphodiesterase [Streptomyces roseirectus]|uniref:Glycerophosphodiester phosphodiesterase n=1 Tax=Streptomyces roseirectus TaxID=2768066 RepID=A0A7H0IET4_9ACTN|nr:glycerophosphodiester phosphodiesterase [Streptomyces roseirectus]QNP71300.1 glycerophosphodiester phosphodiesterase [Streptomyces roseirectus]